MKGQRSENAENEETPGLGLEQCQRHWHSAYLSLRFCLVPGLATVPVAAVPPVGYMTARTGWHVAMGSLCSGTAHGNMPDTYMTVMGVNCKSPEPKHQGHLPRKSQNCP